MLRKGVCKLQFFGDKDKGKGKHEGKGNQRKGVDLRIGGDFMLSCDFERRGKRIKRSNENDGKSELFATRLTKKDRKNVR